MSENEMIITLKLLDQASGQIKKAMGDAGNEAKKFHNEVSSGADESTNKYLKLTLTIGGLIKAYNLVSRGIKEVIAVGRDMDQEFNKSFENFDFAVLKVQQSIAKTLIPTLETALNFWADFLNNAVKDNALQDFNDQISRVQQTQVMLIEQRERLQSIVSERESSPFSWMFSPESLAADKEKIANLDALIERNINLEATLRKLAENEKTSTKEVEFGTKARVALYNAEKANKLAMLNAFSEMTTLLGGESKAAFYILKAIKAAEILVNSAAASMSISAAWAWNPPVEAALQTKNRVLTAINLATVAAATIAGSFAEGVASVPNDMVANIHKGETIIPANFAESIRRGDISLSGGDRGGSDGTNFYIEINNPIMRDRDSISEMAEMLGFEIERKRRSARSIV